MALESHIEETENLVSVVVETRKRFGETCMNYSLKYSNLSLDHLTKNVDVMNVKKYNVSDINIDEKMRALHELNEQLDLDTERTELLRKKIMNTRKIVEQLKGDSFSLLAHQPIKASLLLERAKIKKKDDKCKHIL